MGAGFYYVLLNVWERKVIITAIDTTHFLKLFAKRTINNNIQGIYSLI